MSDAYPAINPIVGSFSKRFNSELRTASDAAIDVYVFKSAATKVFAWIKNRLRFLFTSNISAA